MYVLAYDHQEVCVVLGLGHAYLSNGRALDAVTGVASMSCTMSRHSEREFRKVRLQDDKFDAWA